ncbi:MAG: hypothetical protein LKF61_04580 [Eggerthellaceae bacterium]|nr:hypothetical protein [Eggerthellaceae bacterium]MCH4220638.1 hypothetical protein [Eggerthellaceae bacterium]
MKTPARNSIIISLTMLAILFASAIAARMYYVNNAAPPHQIISYKLNDYVSLREIDETSDIQIASKEYALFTIDEYQHRFGKIDESVLSQNQTCDTKILVLKMSALNKGPQENQTNLCLYSVQQDAWVNGVDLLLYMPLNKAKSANITLQPNEERTVLLPYSMYDFQFGFNDNWIHINENPFELVLKTYPNKVFIALGLPEPTSSFSSETISVEAL